MQLSVLILHMETDVKDIVTATMTRVMYLQAVDLLQQVLFDFKKQN